MTSRLEENLRGMFAERAAMLPPAPDPYSMLRREMRHARQRAVLVACLLVLAVAAVPVAVRITEASVAGLPAAGPPSQRLSGAQAMDPAAYERLLRWPTRGDLAEDAGLLAAVRARAVEHNRRVAVEAVQVIFAGQVDGVPYAVAAVPDNGGTVQRLVLRGPQWNEESLDFQGTGQSLGIVRLWAGGGPGRLLVVAAPGSTRVETSQHQQWHPDATVTRTWTRRPLAGGVAMLDLQSLVPAFVRVRVFAGDRAVYDAVPLGWNEDEGRRSGLADLVSRVRPQIPPGVETRNIEGNLGGLEDFGVRDFASLEVKVLWSGREASQDVALLRVSGVNGTAVQLALGGSNEWDQWASRPLPVPAGQADDPRKVAISSARGTSPLEVTIEDTGGKVVYRERWTAERPRPGDVAPLVPPEPS